MKIILASASPRRRELLAQIGLEFQVMVSHVEEKAPAAEPGFVVEELSRQKAEAVLRELARGEAVLVIGADTVVSVDGRILGKPSDAEDARRMLRILSGRSHEVYTGVTLLYRAGTGVCETEAGPGGGACVAEAEPGEGASVGGADSAGGRVRCRTFHERTRVDFYPMTEGEISRYVSSGDCMDKAGAYGIQGLCARYIKGIEGDYNNVVGLPAGRLYQELFEEVKEWMEQENGEESSDF